MQEIFEKIMAMLEKHRAKYENLCADGEFKDSRYFQGKIEGIDISQKIAKAVATKYNNGWIPCSEGMPTETEKQDDIFDPQTLAIVDSKIYTASDLVLVTVRDYELDNDFTMDDMTVNGKWVNFESDGRYEVIAWQPLPQPYEPKEG